MPGTKKPSSPVAKKPNAPATKRPRRSSKRRTTASPSLKKASAEAPQPPLAPHTLEDGSVARSQDHPSVPWYRLAHAEDLGPSTAELLEFAGIQSTRALTPAEVRKLLRPPIDLDSVADNAARQYKQDQALLRLRNVGLEDIEKLHERMVFLKHRARRFAEAALIAQHQLLIAGSDLQDLLLRVRRRIVALAGEWPELTDDWDFLLSYFERLYPGPTRAAKPRLPEAPENDP